MSEKPLTYLEKQHAKNVKRELYRRRLKARREELGLSTVELARRVGCQTVTADAWERWGQVPRQPRLDVLADVLGVSVDWLVNGEKNDDH